MSEFIVTINGSKRNIEVLSESEIKVDNKKYNYLIENVYGNTFRLKIDNKIYELTYSKKNGELFNISTESNNFETLVRTALQEKATKLIEEKAAHHQKTEVKAPMPGMILKINKNVGDEIEIGESVMILEAMKMENDLKAPITGKMTELFVKEGNAVEKGAKLYSIE